MVASNSSISSVSSSPASEDDDSPSSITLDTWDEAALSLLPSALGERLTRNSSITKLLGNNPYLF